MTAPSRGRRNPTPLPSGALVGRDLAFTYAGAVGRAVDGVSIDVHPGTMVAILGPNGSGKSTLLRMVAGRLMAESGTVTLGDREIPDLPDRVRALCLGVVPQGEASPFPITVRELVSMGRYPHVGAWARLSQEDRAVVEESLVQCGVEELADRDLETLSGGERQRARIARALAQRPAHLLLDEPTTGLDLHYQMEILGLLRDLCDSVGMGVLLVTHDLNLAARFADRMQLLSEGREVASGRPSDVVREDLLEAVYGWPFRVIAHPGPGPDAGAPMALPLARGPAAGADRGA